LALKKNLKLHSSKDSLDMKESRMINDRKKVFQLVRQLIQAQLDCSDKELTKRLWQDVANKGIDLDRVINLMYTCSFHEDDNEMIKVDENFQRTGLVG
tara:strand:- start:537 stop:830 length:294 start_codon:yes stop_codon:yes gene_type:complete